MSVNIERQDGSSEACKSLYVGAHLDKALDSIDALYLIAGNIKLRGSAIEEETKDIGSNLASAHGALDEVVHTLKRMSDATRGELRGLIIPLVEQAIGRYDQAAQQYTDLEEYREGYKHKSPYSRLQRVLEVLGEPNTQPE